MLAENPNPLKVIEGAQLSSVEFVHDYVQLRFDGPALTAITPPRVQVLNQSLEWGKPGYRDALCALIGKLVTQAFTIPEQEIKIEFDNGASISISLKPGDYRTAEAAVFDNPPKPTCVW